jgi:hypothetical protein
MPKFTHPLGLKYSEWLVLSGANHAHRIGSGHFLPAPRWAKAAKRMVERGFLTEVPGASPPLLAVVMTGKDRRHYNRAVKQALARQEGQGGQET